MLVRQTWGLRPSGGTAKAEKWPKVDQVCGVQVSTSGSSTSTLDKVSLKRGIHKGHCLVSTVNQRCYCIPSHLLLCSFLQPMDQSPMSTLSTYKLRCIRDRQVSSDASFISSTDIHIPEGPVNPTQTRIRRGKGKKVSSGRIQS